MGPGDVLERLGSGPGGLTGDDAARRLMEYGPNELREAKRTSPLNIFAKQFKNFLVLILMVAAVASFIIGEPVDAVVILIIVLFAAVLGFIQEYKAERALEALKSMAAPVARVIRGGEHLEIKAIDAVPGDILVLSTGDRIPADARLLESIGLTVDESSLTGESVPNKKDVASVKAETPLADRDCMVFTSTIVIRGRGLAVVTSTGMETEFGKIAKLIQAVETPPTPLEERLDHVGKWLGLGALGVVAIVASLEIFVRGEPVFDMFLWAVALAVAAVPEALPAVVTGALAIGVQRMSEKNAIVRRLPAVETLGSITVICTDKTGTLTRNEMTVREMWTGGRNIQVTGEGYEPLGEFLEDKDKVDVSSMDTFLRIGALCNDARLRDSDGWRIEGDPTEGAILVVSSKGGLMKEELEPVYPRVMEIPFSSERKLMTTIHKTPQDKRVAYVKGAPEKVLDLSGLSKEEKNRILGIADEMASRALRVLGFAYRDVHDGMEEAEIEKDLVFVGLMGMMDAPREEARESVAKCKDAGIKTVMITGDHRITAEAVARELGIIARGGRVIEGRELDDMDTEALGAIVEDVAVYARVSPEHKLKIVESLQSRGHIVAMTGDGVNDAPALKKADIGVAMGITGTDVTKEASDIILTDDNFATIVSAVEEGRGIYDNIRKYILFLLSCNVSEIILVFVAGLLNWPIPLLAIHLLYINLATDGLPAIALGVDPPLPGIMKRPPRDPTESIFKGIKGFIIFMSLFLAGLCLLVFWWALGRFGLEDARTTVFVTLILLELANAFNCRSLTGSIFSIGPFKNKWLNRAVFWEFILLNVVVYVAFFNPLIKTVPLSGQGYVVAFLVALTLVPGVEIYKKVAARTARVKKASSAGR